ncbi:hypothetical protein P175DRAFT_0554808 [Aspergillus ochraceoroseus IBT 24754]|uniref:Major facilitator superfamily (MFS) profile domain-containing protein n=1 Tax=Aspergillus ochraceoroseus IBT 24754 TaxID=1392256 RepID=A0A2T5MAL9_9EURO|nr:uncharacterized protein P175DRAFT_0554808 [Aspergillus ochraceoroseus IBT 24754]PTU25574.1 hypothetical protein P175DRAFT_0554808 [Aspergillus ochraceoroseus IBT 24754]
MKLLTSTHLPPTPTRIIMKDHLPCVSTGGLLFGYDSGVIAGITTISLIYVNITIYNLSWGPLPWPCTAELFLTRIREPGVAIAVSSQWLFNFLWSFCTPLYPGRHGLGHVLTVWRV